MDLTHLHLHVRARSEAFYQRSFGLRTANREDEITFMQGDRDFLFALMDDAAPTAMPPWFHFGIRLDSAHRVRALPEEMSAAQVPIVKPLYDDETFGSFRCADLDAYKIEVYWSPASPVIDVEVGAAMAQVSTLPAAPAIADGADHQRRDR